MKTEAARAIWWAKQALTGDRKGHLAEVLGGAGWLRTLGGADVYIAARARRHGMSRMDLDVVVQKGALVVRPAVRGCIYLAPPAALADVVAENYAAWKLDTAKSLAKAGKKIADVEKLAPAVLAALKAGPLDTNALRKALPKIPSYGEAGKKAGISSPLPLALRKLEFDGEIERTLDAGRLDTDAYVWRVARTRPAAGEADATKRLARVIETFLAFAGPSTIAQVSAWTGRSQRDLKKARVLADVSDVDIDGVWAWMRTADEDVEMDPPKGVALLAFEDNYLVNHGLAAVTATKHRDIECDIWGGTKPEKLGTADHVLSRTIVVDGLIAGFWEVDADANGGAWMTFDKLPKKVSAALEEAVADVCAFLLDELGHAKSFTLDTMADVQARAERIKKLRNR